jgi:hypothetical protein
LSPLSSLPPDLGMADLLPAGSERGRLPPRRIRVRLVPSSPDLGEEGRELLLRWSTPPPLTRGGHRRGSHGEGEARTGEREPVLRIYSLRLGPTRACATEPPPVERGSRSQARVATTTRRARTRRQSRGAPAVARTRRRESAGSPRWSTDPAES